MKMKAKERKRQRETLQRARDKMHTDYLRTLTPKEVRTQAPNRRVSPVGSYIVDSATFEDYFAYGRPYGLCLDIHETDTPGVFQADFDFGFLEGIMMICADEESLEEYCSEKPEWSDSQDEDEDDTKPSDSEEETFKRGSKRKATELEASPKDKETQGRSNPVGRVFTEAEMSGARGSDSLRDQRRIY